MSWCTQRWRAVALVTGGRHLPSDDKHSRSQRGQRGVVRDGGPQRIRDRVSSAVAQGNERWGASTSDEGRGGKRTAESNARALQRSTPASLYGDTGAAAGGRTEPVGVKLGRAAACSAQPLCPAALPSRARHVAGQSSCAVDAPHLLKATIATSDASASCKPQPVRVPTISGACTDARRQQRMRSV